MADDVVARGKGGGDAEGVGLLLGRWIVSRGVGGAQRKGRRRTLDSRGVEAHVPLLFLPA